MNFIEIPRKITDLNTYQNLHDFLKKNNLIIPGCFPVGGHLSSIENSLRIDSNQDLDFFFTSQESLNEIVGNLNQDPFGYFSETEHAYTTQIENVKCQFIKKIYNNYNDTLSSFDISASKVLMIPSEDSWDIINLSSIDFEIPLDKITGLTAQRVLKYWNRGYNPSNIREFVNLLIENWNTEYQPSQYGEPFSGHVMLDNLLNDLNFVEAYKDIFTATLRNLSLDQIKQIGPRRALVPIINIPLISYYWMYSCGYYISKIHEETMQNEIPEYLI